ncbi:MarR family winged helix-turn-helix transcriptional regulator [Actinokineospora cianjurensis]|uniref:DNA-binding MarR family transcriptional regulator n=1 Tax=Actinokineospora cianjurensis TaxID=585224 RepID=A0A421B3T1_9PSEU|nr:MarR family transcriptional regulator [Actinokineospora cianjurensis]RLK59027.1 DNA-binding MarR family transcriptional regulator [Actinokineospora cianjurensis]
MAQGVELVDQWRSMTARYNEIACRLDRELEESHGVSMNEFETLDRLAAHDAEKLRMLDLAAAMYLSQSALSRTVARLERAGLVERALCEADRRGVFVRITDAGRDRYRAASETHRNILAEHLPAAD